MMNGNHNWRDALVDALIAAGSAMFGALAALLAAGVQLDRVGLVAASVAAGVAFFASMAAASKTPPGSKDGP